MQCNVKDCQSFLQSLFGTALAVGVAILHRHLFIHCSSVIVVSTHTVYRLIEAPAFACTNDLDTRLLLLYSVHEKCIEVKQV